MSRIALVWVLSACSVATGVAGCGNQIGAGAGSGSGLGPGIYTGGGSGSMVISGTIRGSQEQFIAAPTSIQISARGIPMVDGAEVYVGEVIVIEAGGLYLESTISSVSPSSDGVVVRYDDFISIDIPEGSAVGSGAGTEVFKRAGQATIQWQFSRLLSGSDGVETVTITISNSGVYTR